MNKDLRHVVFCIDDNFVSHLGILITSIILNNTSKSKYAFHVISSGLSNDNIKQLKSFNKKYSTIHFYTINHHFLSSLSISGDFNQRLNYVTYFRLTIPELLTDNISRIIFLDADMIVTSDLTELWNINIGQKVAGVVADALLTPKEYWKTLHLSFKNYFNAGMMLINLEAWRNLDISSQCFNLLENKTDWQFNDQDILNVILNKSCCYLDKTWNFQTAEKTIASQQFTPKIIHYTGAEKPWHKASIHQYKDLYLRYRNKSIFSNSPSINYLDNHDQLLIKKLSKLPKHSRIAIYGCGHKGRRLALILNEINPTYSIAFFIDKNSPLKNYNEDIVYRNLPNKKFDFVLVASSAYSKEIVAKLISLDIKEKKIIYQLPKK